MIADFAVHVPDKEDGVILNPHFHVMTIMRPINPDGTWEQKQRREYVLGDEENRVLNEAGKLIFNAVPTTDKGELNRWIKATNRLMLDIKKKIKSLFGWISEVKEELSKPKTPSLADLLIFYYQDRNAGHGARKPKERT